MSKITVERNIKQDTSTGKYYVNLYFGRINGKPKRKSVTVNTIKNARLLLKNHEKSMAAKEVSYDVSKTTLIECVNEFISKSNISDTTEYAYKNIARHIATQKISQILICNLKYSDIENYKKNIKRTTSLSNKTINKHLTLIKSSLNFMEKDENNIVLPIIRKITFLDVDKKFKGNYYDENECKALLNSLNNSDDFRIKTAVLLSVECGLRRGEVCGLRWEDMDFINNKISIDNTITQAGSSTIEKGPKTESSQRTIFMPGNVKELLLAYKQDQQACFDILGVQYNNKDFKYVLVDKYGKVVRPNYISQLWKEFTERNNLRHIRFHDLRHTYVSIGYQKGISLLSIAAVVGHSSTKMTSEVYTHLKKDNEIAVGSTIANAIIQSTNIK